MLDVATGQQDHQQEDIDGTLLLEARMLLVAMPGAPSSVPAPSSKARSPDRSILLLVAWHLLLLAWYLLLVASCY